jgi:hypothetical protein
VITITTALFVRALGGFQKAADPSLRNAP